MRVNYNEKLFLDIKQKGIKFKGCILFYKFFNTEKLFKMHKEKSIEIINKIHNIIHSEAIIHLGEINLINNTIIWKENLHEIYFDKIKYLFNLGKIK
jgi:hypothetical protein